MNYRRMGRTGLQLSAVSFGSWVNFSKVLDDAFCEKLMGTAYDAGINFFDNAEIYARGQSELMMGRLLKKMNWERSSYIISSKVFFGWRGENNKPNQTGLSRKHIVEACEEALQRLQLDYLDLYLCHRPDKNVPIVEVVRSMNTLIAQGKILYWGTSEWSAAEILEAHLHAQALHLEGPSLEQCQYNLFERQKMEVDYATIFNNIGMGTTIWSPLASGLLSGKYSQGIPEDSRLGRAGFEWLRDREYTEEKVKKVQQLQVIADELNTTLPTLSIAWCLANPNVSTAILGATKLEQLEENLKAIELFPKINEELKDRIDSLMGTKPTAPQY